MERMKVIYGRNYLPLSLFIRLFTWSHWSHCGVITPCGKYVIESVATQGGVIKTPIDSFIQRYCEVYSGYMPAEDNWQDRLNDHLGSKYDFLAIAGIVFRMGRWNKPNRWFCSELVAYVSGIFRSDRKSRVSPEICFKITKDEDPVKVLKRKNEL